MSKPRDYRLTFAGAGEQEIKATGKFIRVLSAPSSNVFISVDGARALERGAGQEINDADGFTRFTVRTLVAQVVLVCVSDTAQPDNRSNVAVAVAATVAGSTAATKRAAVSIPALATLQVVAANADRNEVRLAIASDQPGGVWFSDSPGQVANEGAWLDAGTVDYPGTTAALYAYNPHATLPVVVSVLDLESP